MADRRVADEPRRIVRCPGCGGDSVYASINPFRPFCGERCRLADLGSWASEGYRVTVPPSVGDEINDKNESAPGIS